MHSLPGPPTSPSKSFSQPKHSPQPYRLTVPPLPVPKSLSSPSSHKPKLSPVPPPLSRSPPKSQPLPPPGTFISLVQQTANAPPSPSLVAHESPYPPPPQVDVNATPPPIRRHPGSSPPPIQLPRTLPPPPPPPPFQNGDAPLSPILKPPQSSPPPPPIFEQPPPSTPAHESSPPPPAPSPPPPQTLVPSPNATVVHVPSPVLPPPSNSPPMTYMPPASPISPLPPLPSSIVPLSSLTPHVSSSHEPAVPSTNHSDSNTPQNSVPRSARMFSTGDIVAIALVLGFVFLGLSGTLAYCVWKQKKKIRGYSRSYFMPDFPGSSPESDSSLLKVKISHSNGSSKGFILSSHEPGGFGNSKSFPYEVLAEATDGFSESNLLGVGGFGFVYKGALKDGTHVAVKQLKIGGGQGEREFRAEVEIISRIHHRNLVSLVGYCINQNRRLLVYDYVPNNNLYYHLRGEGMSVLEWPKRVKIAIGAAHGIAYLHEDCYPRVIHRDIKSMNILLDNCFEAQVSDFGLAKLAMDAKTHVTTRVVGTFGYMAPEYASSGKLTEKSDVFSFGVVLLELITGRKPVDTSQPAGHESLVEWARPLLSEALENQKYAMVADPRLEKHYVDSEMLRMVETAAACVRHSSLKRPTMGQVVRALDNMATMDLTNGMRLGESGFFNEEVTFLQKMAFGPHNSTDFFRQDSFSSSLALKG